MRRSRRLRAGLIALLALVGPAGPALAAPTIYDYANRTPGTNAFAYHGEDSVQVPTTATTPSTVFNAAAYNAIKTDDGVFHSYTVGANNNYGQSRFVITIDEPRASVTRIDATWTGKGVNANNGRIDGAHLYIWNYATSSYTLLQASANTEAKVTLSGAITGNPQDYIGGPGLNRITLLAVDADRKTGSPQNNELSTDYVRIAVTTSIAYFLVIHDGAGIHCLGETVTVVAKAADGTTVTGYTGSITLDTQTGTGTWSSTPGNAGAFSDATPNDGRATYTFAPADAGRATFVLDYRSGPASFDIDAFETANPAVRDDDSEGLIRFSPSGFTVTASALSNPPPNPLNSPIPTQTAGLPFALHLTAYGQTPTDPVCGVIESYTGGKSLKFWFDFLDPATGTRAVTIDGAPIPAAEAAAAAQAVVFSNGQAAVTAKYKDVGLIRIRMKDDTVTEPAGGIRGATNPFVVKPASFVVTSVERPDGSPNPGTAIPTGPVFVAAGTPFRATVEVRDAEGDLTPNYGREATPEGLRLEAATLVAPAGGRNGTANDGAIANGTAFAVTATPGRFLGTTFSWDEVGAITLRARVADGDYLGAGDVTGTVSGTVGRFVPDHFDVALNAPQLGTVCPSGGFTYWGELFDYTATNEPRATVTARNAGGTTTANYAGSWFRLTATSLTGLAYASATGTLSVAAPNLPTVTDLGGGLGSILFDTGPPLSFVRGAPGAPFDAEIALALDVVDLDGVLHPSNPVRFGDASPGNGMAWSAGKSIRWGRLVVGNAHGSELVTLPVPLRAEWFDGTSFLTHLADACTSLPLPPLQLTPVPGSLVTTPSLAHDPLVAGDAGLSLSPPGVGNTGYVDLLYDLSPAGADRPWLRYDWDGDGSHDDDPTGRATFGIYAGEDALIHRRELY